MKAKENGRNGRAPSPAHNGQSGLPAVITGGAGFIGSNLAHRLLSDGCPVIIFDNLSRPNVEKNLNWLIATHGDLVQIEVADIRDRDKLERAIKGSSQVFHFAAQVAVTTSLVDPIRDFEVNARGTINLLESLRKLGDAAPPLVFTSTNKVYGSLNDIPLNVRRSRYQPTSPMTRKYGINEDRPIEFYSPYSCSKGAADQYVLDYARTFGLPTVVFRMSCIYGEHQFGTEDQGWVAHFLIQALDGNPITVYGDGMQVRDVLFADDLVEAMILARDNMDEIAGQAFNIGGGPENSVSLMELLNLISEMQGDSCIVKFEGWRAADQRYYVSDCRRFSEATGWQPKYDVRSGLERLRYWLLASRLPESRASVAGEPGGKSRPSGTPVAARSI